MAKSGIRNFEANGKQHILGASLQTLPEAVDLTSVTDFEGYLDNMCTALRAREQGVQESLRQDLTWIYTDACQIKANPGVFSRFAELPQVSKLPRPPKTPDSSLFALLKLAYMPKTASARHCRLKALWKSGASAEQVYADLTDIGSAPKDVQATFEPHNANAFGFRDLQAGDEIGLFIWAKVRSPHRLALEIVDRLEWPD